MERIQYRALYVSPEEPFGRYCNQYIKKSLLRKYGCKLQMSLMIFVKCLIAQEAETGNTAASNAHQTQDLCTFITKAFTQ